MSDKKSKYQSVEVEDMFKDEKSFAKLIEQNPSKKFR